MNYLLKILLAALVTLIASLASAEYPDRTIALVTPYPPGGAADITARILASKFTEQLGVPVIVENKPGGGSAVGTQYVANAKPDGYTLLMGSNSALTIIPAIQQKISYNPAADFEPIGIVGNFVLALILNPKVSADTLPDLVGQIKANPNKFVYGSYGSGTASNFAGELFNDMTGLALLQIPYKGSAPLMNDLISGQIPLGFDTVLATAPQLKAGRIKALAVTSLNRSTFLPTTPTLNELGLTGFDMTAWTSVLAPRGLAPEVRRKLQTALNRIMTDQDSIEKLQAAGVDINYKVIKDWDGFIKADTQKMKALAIKANIKAD